MTNPIEPLCEFCGEVAVLDVLEYFKEERSFLLDTCCEAMENIALETLHTLSRNELATWFEAATGVRIRQIIAGVELPTWTVDAGLDFCEVTLDEAKSFVADHHRHNAPPLGWKYGIGLRSGSELVAVMMAGRPVARNLDPRVFIEITRVCVKNLFPHALGWNSCSMLYGYACRIATKRGYQTAITYTHPVEIRAELFLAILSTATLLLR